jgi:hypothetical protein
MSIVWNKYLEILLGNELFEKWRISPPPSPLVTWQVACRHVISGGRVISAGPRVGPTTLGGGGGGLGCPLAGFPPTQGNIVFCLVLLNYMTSRLCFWCYILLLTQSFIWCKCNHRVMATFSCVAQKAASAAQKSIPWPLTLPYPLF